VVVGRFPSWAGLAWAAEVVLLLGCCWIAPRAAQVGFPLFLISNFYLLFLFTDLNLLFDFKFELCLILQVLNYLNIKTILIDMLTV
jgi:hypothetical protein